MVCRSTGPVAFASKIYESIGAKMLFIAPPGFRESSSNKAVRSYEDLSVAVNSELESLPQKDPKRFEAIQKALRE